MQTRFEPKRKLRGSGFTLVEALITIAIIGVMAAAVLSAFSNAADDAKRVVARQQQAVVQAAVSNWVSAQLSGQTTVAEVRSAYNESAPSTARTSLGRLQLVGSYLDDATLADLTDSGNGGGDNAVKSHVLAQTSQYLVLPDWSAGSYPKVSLLP